MRVPKMLLALGLALAAAGSALADELTVAYFERPPYYETLPDGRAGGFLLDVVRKALEQAGIAARYVPVPAKRILAEMPGRRNYCSPGWFRTPERESFAVFSLPIYRGRPMEVLIRASDRERFQGLPTLAAMLADPGLRLGLVDGFSYGPGVDALLRAASPRTERVVGEPPTLVRMLAKGRFDCMLTAPEETDTIIRAAGLAPELFAAVTPPDMEPGPPRFLMCGKELDPGLMERLNRILSRPGGVPAGPPESPVKRLPK